MQLGVSGAIGPHRDGPLPHTQDCQGHGALCPTTLGTFPMGSWLIDLPKAHARQGQPPRRCFLIYLYSPGSPVLINYHLHSNTQEGDLLGGEWGQIEVEIQSRSSGCKAWCWQPRFFPEGN